MTGPEFDYETVEGLLSWLSGCLTGDSEILRDLFGPLGAQSRTVPRRWPGWMLLALAMK